MTDTIKILLVDDHHLVRTGIANLLSGEPEIEVAGEAADAGEMLELLKVREADLAILDIALPDVSGIELARQMAKEFPKVKVIFLSMYTSEEFVFNAINSGAKGYLPKNISRAELLDAVRAVYRGEEYFAESISNTILKSYIKKAKSGNLENLRNESQLSKREVEVLKWFAQGLTNQEIADKLFISIRTVESHKNHIMQRLELKTTVDLIKFAIRNNLVNL
ncbi:MAG TPA: response regulator transcription factor [Bacteroidales bacterium]|nr:response regulator transcription factor [Bacteroidales bacterium]HPT01711.1 response regulator transcription factor [Bacteroidales bacterium]